MGVRWRRFLIAAARFWMLVPVLLVAVALIEFRYGIEMATTIIVTILALLNFALVVGWVQRRLLLPRHWVNGGAALAGIVGVTLYGGTLRFAHQEEFLLFGVIMTFSALAFLIGGQAAVRAWLNRKHN